MKRWIALAATLYPRNWREQYGREFDALLDDVRPGWRVFANVLGGAVRMQMTNRTNWLKLIAATAAAGAIVSGGISFTAAPRYISSATVSVTPQPDPLRHTSPQALRQRAAEHFAQIEKQILSRQSLASIINNPTINLYASERSRMPLEDIEDQMRRNIRMQVRSPTDDGWGPIVFSISFSYPDRMKAQSTARELAARLTEENVWFNRNQAQTYEEFWKHMSAARLANPTPPPPPGDIAAVLGPASLPKESVGPSTIEFLAWGLGSGLLLGLLAGLAMRRPHAARVLAACAAAGCVVAATASFLIPKRYTATAVMQIVPAQLTDNPRAALPAPTPASEFLRQTEPQILSHEALSMMIRDPRLNLYPEERARRPIEEVVRKMLARDLRIAVLNPQSGSTGPVSTFSISFSYSDRGKAQDLVNALITGFLNERFLAEQAKAWRMNDAESEIHARRAGESLEVVDQPIVPQYPESPNRLLIAATGLGIGLLIGFITLRVRRPGAPTLQPA